ncbi:prepilin peptidase [Nocardioides jiangxiensis]|uniref:Prepilin leader peptidase/N-methyltransferase n=1 Tax=Nocardioides jiangxiensis TaxID=3064524 RepID=A0ABT9AZF8_9ACTN|nr:A24 family peptidase [Nocardioides sp. WY-20]MDO7867404.1 prepilin peptidase [Nocardioides sp. WY-20]
MTPVAWAAVAGVLGLLIGSFLNVVAWRVPRGESIVSPPSACPACGHVIRARDNVPVLGWVLLRGRCRDCRAPISARYPLVELGTGVLFAVVALRLGDRPALLPAYLAFVAGGVALALIDLDVRRLPDVIVLPLYVVLPVLLAVDGDPHALLRAALGGALLGGVYLVIAVVARGAMGWGDVKLAAPVGAMLGYLSWGTLLAGGFGAFVIGAVVGVLLIVVSGAGRKTAVPFGPFMLVGAAAAILGAGGLGDAYLRAVGAA